MNSEFEEWIAKKPHNFVGKMLAHSAWNTQQDKIDKLKKQVEELQLELIQALSDSENYGFGEK
jgi:hypothetical protein